MKVKKPAKRRADDIKFVRCPECNHEQADMGRGVRCENEECGYGPMPSESAR